MKPSSAALHKAAADLSAARKMLADARRALARLTQPGHPAQIVDPQWQWAHDLMEKRRAKLLAIPGVVEKIDIGWFYIPVAMFIIVGTSNAVNLTDGLDDHRVDDLRVARDSFGEFEGQRVDQFTLSSDSGVEVDVINYGVAVRDWRVPVVAATNTPSGAADEPSSSTRYLTAGIQPFGV